MTPPRPPNRTGGFPAYGSPVGSFFIESVSQSAKLCKRATRLARRRCRPTFVDQQSAWTPLPAPTPCSVSRSKLPPTNRASAPCAALAGTEDAFFASFRSSHIYLPTLPSLGAALLSALFAAHHRGGTMRVLTPAAPRTTRQASPFHPPGLPDIPSPTTSCARASRFLITSVRSVGSLQSQASPMPLGGSPLHAAESGSYSYRLSIRLQLLPTPPRGDAVAFGYICGDFTWYGLPPY